MLSSEGMKPQITSLGISLISSSTVVLCYKPLFIIHNLLLPLCIICVTIIF